MPDAEVWDTPNAIGPPSKWVVEGDAVTQQSAIHTGSPGQTRETPSVCFFFEPVIEDSISEIGNLESES